MAVTFKITGETWRKAKEKGMSDATLAKMRLVLDDYLYPAIGARDVATVTSGDVVKVLQGMPRSLADKAAGYCRSVIRRAILNGKRPEGHLLDLDLRHNLPKRQKGHMPAATGPPAVADVMRTIRGLESDVTRAALSVCAYTSQRPGNVATMQWRHMDVQTAEWIIPAKVMKMPEAHIVLLSAQALVAIESTRNQPDADKVYVFPPQSQKENAHLHRDALSKALRDAGLRGKQTPHGLRATMRTCARERLKIAPGTLERQLAHMPRGDTATAYDRAGLVDERHAAVQEWADWLDGPMNGVEAISSRQNAG